MSDTLHWSGFNGHGAIKVLPIKELCETLEWKFLEQEEEIKRVREENVRLKSEHYKDDELQKLQKKLTDTEATLYRGFGISEKEQVKINEWMNNHNCTFTSHVVTKFGGPGPSSYRFDIIPGIGYNAYVKCKCGKEYCFYEE